MLNSRLTAKIAVSVNQLNQQNPTSAESTRHAFIFWQKPRFPQNDWANVYLACILEKDAETYGRNSGTHNPEEP